MYLEMGTSATPIIRLRAQIVNFIFLISIHNLVKVKVKQYRYRPEQFLKVSRG
jgi:hypothetical protein